MARSFWSWGKGIGIIVFSSKRRDSSLGSFSTLWKPIRALSAISTSPSLACLTNSSKPYPSTPCSSTTDLSVSSSWSATESSSYLSLISFSFATSSSTTSYEGRSRFISLPSWFSLSLIEIMGCPISFFLLSLRMKKCRLTPNYCVLRFKESILCLTFSESLLILFRVVLMVLCLRD